MFCILLVLILTLIIYMYQKIQATQIYTGTELLEDQLVLITQKDGTIEAMVG